MADSRCRVFIVTVYNDAKDITAQILTVYIAKEENKYILHNVIVKNRFNLLIFNVTFVLSQYYGITYI